MLDYDLAEMKSADGLALKWELDARAYRAIMRIAASVMSTATFNELSARLPSPRLSLYYKYAIKKAIDPFMRQACVITWYRRNGKAIPKGEDMVAVPDTGIFRYLKSHWEFGDIPVKLIDPVSYALIYDKDAVAARIRAAAKKCVLRMREQMHRIRYPAAQSPGLKSGDGRGGICSRRIEAAGLQAGELHRQPHRGYVGSEGMIACHYSEGMDLSRRNDINWHHGSGVRPEQVLIYLDGLNFAFAGRPIPRDVLGGITKLGFRWIALDVNIVQECGANYWFPSPIKKEEMFSGSLTVGKEERWVCEVARDLTREVHYWKSFHEEFNVKVHYITEEGFSRSIAQAVAFDIMGPGSGILVGRQRSELYMPYEYWPGYHPKHILFVWNKRCEKYLKGTRDHIEKLVITGHPNNIFQMHERRAVDVRKTGARFIVALFDTGYGPNSHSSAKNIERFYNMFLQWVIDDPEVGVIIKSKQPYVINNIVSMHGLLEKAIATGRCMRIKGERGMFPTEASNGADMAVGIDISTAVIEAVISGTRGIDFDSMGLKNHEFYAWGRDRVIFNSLEDLVSAVKQYKSDKGRGSRLGDWSDHLDELDPFRDGKGGHRMGNYMRWLLESFNAGNDRDAAIRLADKAYSDIWGEDKIIDMAPNYGEHRSLKWTSTAR